MPDGRPLEIPSREELRRARQLAGLTQEDLAERTGMSVGWIRNIERNPPSQPNTGYDNLEDLVESLNAVLLAEDEQRP